MKSRTAVLSATALVAVSLGGPAMAIEEPRYQLLEQDERFELRRYAPRIVAEVEVSGEFEEAGNTAFRPLADYIFGNNIAEQKIAMTAPVTQEPPAGQKIAMTAPVTQQASDDRHLVRFAMPAAFTMETLPKPRNQRV